MREKEREKITETYILMLKKLAEKRAKAGISQIDLASSIGLSESGYFKVEKGKTKLDLERLLLILYKLNIHPKDFFKDFAF